MDGADGQRVEDEDGDQHDAGDRHAAVGGERGGQRHGGEQADECAEAVAEVAVGTGQRHQRRAQDDRERPHLRLVGGVGREVPAAERIHRGLGVADVVEADGSGQGDDDRREERHRSRGKPTWHGPFIGSGTPRNERFRRRCSQKVVYA